jgi:uncharacterized protein YutE (UPF0331/DUF86 family)
VDDVLLEKAGSIERCVERIRAVYGADPKNLKDDLTKQESILLNLQRACEASIDAAMRVVKRRGLGLPNESRAAFELLHTAGHLEAPLAEGIKKMVGFRNVAVHGYRKLDLDIVQAIIEKHLSDLLAFSTWAIAQARGG